MTADVAIRVENLSKTYRIFDKPQNRLKQLLSGGRGRFYREHHALNPISFNVYKGETIGIVGRNGSGKSTLLQMVCGTLSPSTGTVDIQGRVSALLELGSGFNPEFTGKENVFLNAMILGLTENEVKERYDAIIKFSGLEDTAIAQPVKNYSSGMVVRLAFAVAVHTDPDILIVDEAMSVGDEAFQLKCFHKIKAIQQQGATILFVSHDTNSIVRICNRAIMLEHGDFIAEGNPKHITTQYHRFIFAPVEAQPQIIADIKNGVAATVTAHTPSLSQSSEELIQSLVPEGTTIYESSGATIKNPHIENTTGQIVNLLNQRQTYRYVYEVHFSEDTRNVGFGMMLRTSKGVDLGGGYTGNPGKPLVEFIKAGSVVRVSFSFDTLLEPGTYYLNCGCIGDNSIVSGGFLHRITDAVAFKVVSKANTYQTGLIDFQIKPDLEFIT